MPLARVAGSRLMRLRFLRFFWVRVHELLHEPPREAWCGRGFTFTFLKVKISHNTKSQGMEVSEPWVTRPLPKILDNKESSQILVLPTMHHVLSVTLDPNESTELNGLQWPAWPFPQFGHRAVYAFVTNQSCIHVVWTDAWCNCLLSLVEARSFPIAQGSHTL